jgi:hypothetical protein
MLGIESGADAVHLAITCVAYLRNRLRHRPDDMRIGSGPEGAGLTEEARDRRQGVQDPAEDR